MSKMKLISMLLLVFLLDCVCTNPMESLKINTTFADQKSKEVLLENRRLLEHFTKRDNKNTVSDFLFKLVKYVLSILVKYFPWLDILIKYFSIAKIFNSPYDDKHYYSVPDYQYQPQSRHSN